MNAAAATTAVASPPSWRWRTRMRHHHHQSALPSFPRRIHPQLKGLGFCMKNGSAESTFSRSSQVHVLPWDDKPFEILPSGGKAFLDEQDIVTFLDPPKELIPLDSTSYNPAAYLWKKIDDIPEERRHQLLRLLKPKLVSRAWQVAGTRYGDSKLVKKIASTSLFNSNKGGMMLEYYNCRTSGGQMPISWINSFRKAIFSCKNGQIYGRLIGGSVLTAFAESFAPLYFTVTQLKEVMSTEQPCDLAYEFGDGLYDIKELPVGFPRPVKHPYPFNDQIMIYVRYLGPGVSVAQAWQEGTKLEQVPRKLCGEILMVKDYTS